MNNQSNILRVVISIHEILPQVKALLSKSPFPYGVSMDIVVRAWELATIDPVEYYDELRSVIYDELYSMPSSNRVTGSQSGGNLRALEAQADWTFKQLHDLLLELRPFLDNSIKGFRIEGEYEYNILDLQYKPPVLMFNLLRSDKVAEYYRSRGQVL